MSDLAEKVRNEQEKRLREQEALKPGHVERRDPVVYLWHARCDQHPPQDIWVGSTFLTQQEANNELMFSDHFQHKGLNGGRVAPVLP